jgi:hypothetical protein
MSSSTLLSPVSTSRGANLIDVLRLFAALCIVWYHNSYFFSLTPSDQSVIFSFKQVLLSWAMPFFYVTMVSFAWRTGIRARQPVVRARLYKMAALVGVFTVVYEIPRLVWYLVEYLVLHPSNQVPYLPLSVDISSPVNALSTLVTTIVTVNTSPVYFLNHAIVLTIGVHGVLFLLQRLSWLKWPLVLFCMFSVAFVASGSFLISLPPFLPINQLAIFCALLALGYELSLAPYIQARQRSVALSRLVAVSMVVALGVGLVTWAGFSLYAALGAIFFLIFRDRFTVVSQGLGESISRWGREYSLGLFLWHYAACIFFAHLAKLFYHGDSKIMVYGITTVAATAITLGMVKWLYAHPTLRWIVTL